MFYKSNDNLIFSSKSVLEKKRRKEERRTEDKEMDLPRYMGLDKTIVCFFIACYFSLRHSLVERGYQSCKNVRNHVIYNCQELHKRKLRNSLLFLSSLIWQTTEYFERAENAPR